VLTHTLFAVYQTLVCILVGANISHPNQTGTPVFSARVPKPACNIFSLFHTHHAAGTDCPRRRVHVHSAVHFLYVTSSLVLTKRRIYLLHFVALGRLPQARWPSASTALALLAYHTNHMQALLENAHTTRPADRDLITEVHQSMSVPA